MTESLLGLIHDLANKMLDGDISYAEAVKELKERYPDTSDDRYESLQSAECFLQKIRDKAKVRIKEERKPRAEEGIYPLETLPNEYVWPIMEEVVGMIRSGAYTPDILEHLIFDYGLSDGMAAYFNNEALSMVRMKTLTDEEFVMVGQEYNRQMLEVLKATKQKNNQGHRRQRDDPPEPIKVEK